ncbi:hypothetical protein [Pelosinus baikalensis]|uniref:Uncharacterized protein n=1 Tax=Pelosinus baikalensis TaxID=2892015 RepID=A0ABS8HYD3_9FIRM|nr:hypothetical protein [Pelosinus baikalensis]MCC5464576.1 hypothetical protein [Pelosinus baikalensis]MCC5467519.1 hypothetical protein [Pelosinus baikalensis]
MAYPNQIDQFDAKLNKKTDGSVYVIEEQLPLTAGKYEGLLAHDNITNTTIRVYTGSKLTGQEVINYIISVPSETPWRRHIKVFADVAKVYVTYETPGDTVEADDVNVLQQSMTATQTEVERYKVTNDLAIHGLDTRLTTHTNNKTNPHNVTVTQIGAETPAGAQAKADVAKNVAIATAASDATTKTNAVQGNLNTHTANVTDAHDTANRLQALRTALTNYIDQSIAAIVSGAPEMLDTLYELSNALGNDPNFSATITNLIGQKLAASEVVTVATANKVLRLDANGKFLATVITQSADYRFVTDTEKTAWTGKSSLALGETSATAYRGDRGKIAYDHSQTVHAPVMDIATQAEAETGTSNVKYMTPLRVKQAIAANPLPAGLTWNQIKGV